MSGTFADSDACVWNELHLVTPEHGRVWEGVMDSAPSALSIDGGTLDSEQAI